MRSNAVGLERQRFRRSGTGVDQPLDILGVAATSATTSFRAQLARHSFEPLQVGARGMYRARQVARRLGAKLASADSLLIHRFGCSRALSTGCSAQGVCALCLTTTPPFITNDTDCSSPTFASGSPATAIKSP